MARSAESQWRAVRQGLWLKKELYKEKACLLQFSQKNTVISPHPIAFWLEFWGQGFVCVYVGGYPNTYYVAQANLKLLTTSCCILPYPELGL